MIIDSHCHLDYEPMFSSLDEVINRALKSKIKYMLTISVVDKKYNIILDIIEKYPSVYGTYGIHPHEANAHSNIDKEIILKRIKLNKKIIGIGETGLDFFHNHSSEKNQISLFREHIEASIQSKLPLIVHSRAAEEMTYKILSEYSKNNDLKILMHCFTGSKEFAQKLLDLNTFFSASGIVTFKNTRELKDTFKSLPLERILVETDSPYLSPEPLRGKSNEPSNVLLTAKYLANLKEVQFDIFCKKTSENFFTLFGKLN